MFRPQHQSHKLLLLNQKSVIFEARSHLNFKELIGIGHSSNFDAYLEVLKRLSQEQLRFVLNFISSIVTAGTLRVILVGAIQYKELIVEALEYYGGAILLGEHLGKQQTFIRYPTNEGPKEDIPFGIVVNLCGFYFEVADLFPTLTFLVVIRDFPYRQRPSTQLIALFKESLKPYCSIGVIQRSIIETTSMKLEDADCLMIEEALVS